MSRWLDNPESYRAFYDTQIVPKPDPFRSVYMQHFHPEPGDTIVDLGCGTGASCHRFAKLGHRVTGVECGRPFLLHCRNQSDGSGNPRFVESLIEEWVPDEKYDWALLTEVLEHVIDPLPCLKVAREAAKKLFLTVPTVRVGTEVHVRGIKPYEMNELFKASGWTVKWMAIREAWLGKPASETEERKIEPYYQLICEAE